MMLERQDELKKERKADYLFECAVIVTLLTQALFTLNDLITSCSIEGQ